MEVEERKAGENNSGFVGDDESLRRDPSFATLEIESDSHTVNQSKSTPHLTTIDLGHCDSNGKYETVKTENVISRHIVKFRSESQRFYNLHKKLIQTCFRGGIIILYHVYLVCAIIYNVDNQLPFGWCNGVGFLIVVTCIVYWSLLYYFLLKLHILKLIRHISASGFRVSLQRVWKKWYIKTTVGVVLSVGFLALLILDTSDQPRRLVSAAGIPVFLLVGLIMSKYPGRVRWSQVFWSVIIQFTFGLIILRWESGRHFLDCISEKVKIFLDYSTVGSDFIYGYLSSGKPTDGLTFPTIFVFRGLSVIFFFGFVISLLYHYGVMTWVIVKLGWALQISLGTTAAESMNAAANIFIGQTEAPLLIKPFINQMTKSELHAIMTGGFATIAGTVMAAYISFGISASYLLSASVMAAPAALGFAKLMYPETKVSTTTAKDIKLIQTKSEGNALDAAAHGAIQGVTLIGCIVANIIAFVSFVAFLNGIISWFGGLVGLADLSFEIILSKLFIPVAWMIGIDSEECESVALLLGLKTIANEFIAYKRLGEMTISPRSRAIATYALCSFANVGSIGIQLGGLGAIAPERRQDVAKTIGRAFLSGTLVGFLNAAMAGMLLSEQGFSEWNFAKNANATV